MSNLLTRLKRLEQSLHNNDYRRTLVCFDEETPEQVLIKEIKKGSARPDATTADYEWIKVTFTSSLNL